MKPSIGREFNRGDELPGRDNVVIVSNRLWRTKLHAAPEVIGATIQLNQMPYTIVCVMLPHVEHPGNVLCRSLRRNRRNFDTVHFPI
ncbi:MAG TPA: ABC transporter permease [Bryobacteraceae bacterium]